MASSFERVILGYITGVKTNEGAKAIRLASFQLDGRREPLCLTRMWLARTSLAFRRSAPGRALICSGVSSDGGSHTDCCVSVLKK